jgi:hypothetical protein
MPQTKLPLDGPKVAADPRGWYALIDDDFYVAVYHPKDAPPDPPMWGCACGSRLDALEMLIDEGYLNAPTS